MHPFEQSFFFLPQTSLRLKFFDEFLEKHYDIKQGGAAGFLLLHISLSECDGFTQFLDGEKERNILESIKELGNSHYRAK